MPLIKYGEIAADRWRTIGDDEPIAGESPVIVSFERWQRERESVLGRNQEIGIRLKAGQHPQAIIADLPRLALIALEFPKFTDGRAYSYARLLRERYGYTGELRAVGQVLRDQLLFMRRCGFDAFEIPAANALESWRTALAELSVFYQPTGDGKATATVLRHRRATEAARRASEEVDA